MQQIVNSVTETVIRFVEQYGAKVALAILAFVACGVALRLISRVTGGGAKEG